ncbi:hypothetical protein LCGC14_0350380 [marine sediment metagenome]|uniref:SIS domain-containing protein n=1 Tax=marine sediment metagenome TaxID=412755 RepID=A0A0F9VYJ9_9ZZZZ
MQTDTLVNRYLNEHVSIAQGFPVLDVIEFFDLVENTYKMNGEVFVFGNGGGASIAEHFASDLKMHPFVSDDKHKPTDTHRLRVHCLNESNGIITRIGNDIGYYHIFIEQLKNYDLNELALVVAFSGSGNSLNIIKALQYANDCDAITVLIGGRDGGKAKDLADLCILIPGTSKFPGQVGANDNCFHIEDFQCSITHIVTGLLKEAVDEGN